MHFLVSDDSDDVDENDENGEFIITSLKNFL